MLWPVNDIITAAEWSDSVVSNWFCPVVSAQHNDWCTWRSVSPAQQYNTVSQWCFSCIIYFHWSSNLLSAGLLQVTLYYIGLIGRNCPLHLTRHRGQCLGRSVTRACVLGLDRTTEENPTQTCFHTLSRMNVFRYGMYPWLETGPSSSSLKCSSSATGSCGILITVHKLWDSTWNDGGKSSVYYWLHG